MSAIADAEQLALSLSNLERGKLITRLIDSLGTPLEDTDRDDLAIALERDRETDEHPETIMSKEDFWGSIEEFRA